MPQSESDSANLLLASASPRRRDLLESIGVKFSVEPQEIDETTFPNESAEDYVARVAREKAESALLEATAHQVILSADTTVVANNSILGKPANADEAATMLALLSNDSHRVLTAVCVGTVEQLRSVTVESKVWFRPIDASEIADYWASGEPQGKAGAYAIQGFAATFVKHIEGSYSNIVGLPLFEVASLLKEFGIAVWNAEAPR